MTGCYYQETMNSDSCSEKPTVSCKICDGDFCREHYDKTHQKGECEYD